MEEKIVNIIAQVLEIDSDEIELDTAVGDLPEWDSLHHLQIIAALEAEYGVKYLAEDLLELEDVSDIIKLTEDLLA